MIYSIRTHLIRKKGENMETMAKFIELIKLPLTYISAFLLTSSCFIFAPDNILIDLGVKDLRDTYRSYIGVVFILSFSIVFVNVIAGLYKKLRKRYINYKVKRIGIQTLKGLNNAEKEILSEMLNNGTYSTGIDITAGVHKRLEVHRLIYRSSSVSMCGPLFSYNIQPWVSDYLKKHNNLLN